MEPQYETCLNFQQGEKDSMYTDVLYLSGALRLDQVPRRIRLVSPLSYLRRGSFKHLVFLSLSCLKMEVYLMYNMKVKSEIEVTQLSLTLCDPMDGSLPRLRDPWDFPGKNTGVGCHFLLQGIFPTQGSNLGLLHCRQTLYHLSHQGSPRLTTQLW